MAAPVAIPRVRYDAEDFEARLADGFVDRGVVVIEAVFSPEECGAAMDSIVSDLERLSPQLHRDAPETWSKEKLPPQTRAGLFQAVVGNLAAVWRIRADPRLGRIFGALYSALSGRAEGDFIASGDGINLKPNLVGPYGETRDWPHLDQTRGGVFRCVQGQAVLTDTTAAFRASPGSHRAFGAVLAATGGQTTEDWRKFTPEEAETARALIEAAGGQWQVPVAAPRGSFIVWASSVVHSARLQLAPEPADPADAWRGWRGVVYVCYRPRREFTEAQLRRRRAAYEANRTTNHWATKTFPKNPMGRYGPAPSGLAAPDGRSYVEHPELVYEALGRPVLAAGRERRLAGYDDDAGAPSEQALAQAENVGGAIAVRAEISITDDELSDILDGVLDT